MHSDLNKPMVKSFHDNCGNFNTDWLLNIVEKLLVFFFSDFMMVIFEGKKSSLVSCGIYFKILIKKEEEEKKAKEENNTWNGQIKQYGKNICKC